MKSKAQIIRVSRFEKHPILYTSQFDFRGKTRYETPGEVEVPQASPLNGFRNQR
jgi:hypothetical protein